MADAPAGGDNRTEAVSNHQYAIDLARALAGALIFAYPLIMTMEMWSIGFYIEPVRLLMFLVLGLGVLVGLAYYNGFEAGGGSLEAVMDGLTAYGAGFLGSAAIMWLLGILTSDLGWRDVVGMVAIQAVPAGIGATVARKQLGGSGDEDPEEDQAGYLGQLFLMAAGALFLGFNVAPTEEMILITFAMSPVQLIGLMAFSIVLLHVLVYTVGFAGQARQVEGVGSWTIFFTYTLAGYGLALLLSAYVLWTFGRTDDASLSLVAMMTVVLAFPASLGAGIARLVV